MSGDRRQVPLVTSITTDGPNDWTARRLKSLCRLKSGDGITAESIEDVGAFPVYGGNGVRGFTNHWNIDGVYPLIGRQGALCGNVHLVRGRVFASEHAVVARPASDVNPSWLAYSLRAMNLRQYSQAAAQPGLAVERIALLAAPMPPHAEQGLIVRYLDHAELRIAKAVAAKQEVVRLLREQKAVVESGALFGGGWKTGVDKWFGEVPSGWDVLPSRALFAERIERDRGDLEMLSVTIARGVVKQSSYLKSDGSKKDQAREDRSQYKAVEPHDLVYNKMRAWQGAAGKSEFRGIVSPAYVVLRPFNGANSDYYGMVLRSRQFAREAERYSYGITSDMWSLRPQHFKIIEFPCPPLSEQAAIVDRCRTQTKKIDLAIETIETEILLLKEYRTRLISDVVTGKLDVREEASKLPEIDPMVLATVAEGENGDDEEASDDD